jgi:hypothetical protein
VSGFLVPILSHARAGLFHGDATLLGSHVRENFVDALITDPPAGIGFMGTEWDGDKGGRARWIAWLRDLLVSSYRAMKPGAHGLVWALPRTSHWTATALEDVGFEIRDVHHHLFGTGFPKSLTAASADIPTGTGTALKPAVEHWILVRKPLDGTLEQNFARWGTGVIAVDACRIDGKPDAPGSTPPTANSNRQTHGAMIRQPYVVPDGRWPAHLSLDEFAADELDAQAGVRKSGSARAGGSRSRANTYGEPSGPRFAHDIAASSGGASRFFFVAKPSRKERDLGLDHLAASTGGEATGREDGSKGTKNPRAGAGRTGGARNTHPTVKSIALMRWLVRLITPPGGIVLDPFAGSGSTGVAALAEGARFLGVELGAGDDDRHIPILLGRIRHALETPNNKDPET